MPVLKKKNLDTLLQIWELEYVILAPSRFGNDVLLSEYNPETFTLDYVNFTLPPKQYLFEMKEKLYDWEKNEDGSIKLKEPALNIGSRILFGIRPCDAYSVAYMDKFFSETYSDPYFWAKRSKTYTVALNCVAPGNKCFCSSIGTGPFGREGADLVFTPMEDEYFVEVLTRKGEQLINSALSLFEETGPEYLVKKAKILKEVKSKFTTEINLDRAAELLDRNYDNHIWDLYTNRCVECHGCTFVCPTCLCFNVLDSADAEGGTRSRHWDSCQSSYFTRNAGGHNPRSETSKFRYRIYDKLKYITEKFDMHGCVGCGRCIQTCLGHLSIIDIIKELQKYEEDISRSDSGTHRCGCNLYIPQTAVIKEVHQETHNIKRFIVQYEDKDLHKSFKYQGQFFEITVFGVGEIPISIPWAPSNNEYFEFVIKKAGRVTTAIHNLEVGDKIGLRGPFGRGFPTEIAKGFDLLFIGSGVGLAPVRTAILHALENRESYGRIVIIARALNYEGLVYKQDLKNWENINGVDVIYALSEPSEHVEAYTGKLDALLKSLDLDWKNTRAIVCGSPQRIKLVAQDLVEMGVDENQIFTTLETHMRCGVGKCGHCKVGSKYMCLDGPVFTYREMKELPPEY